MKNLAAWTTICLTFAVCTGCLGSIRQSSAERTARKQYTRQPNCTDDMAKPVVVKEMDDPKFDYLAEVKVTGCANENHYLCGQKDSAWECTAMK